LSAEPSPLRRSFALRWAAIIALSGTLGGCGQTGPLYLPEGAGPDGSSRPTGRPAADAESNAANSGEDRTGAVADPSATGSSEDPERDDDTGSEPR
jgi:predicted small lipoprotein YifL